MFRFNALLIACLLLVSGLAAETSFPYFADNATKIDSTQIVRTFTETPPPVAPVRPVAEFEPATQVLIRYPLGFPTALVAQLANVAQVVCIVVNSTLQTSATSAFQNAGVNMANVTWMIAPTNTYWTRDYGPWFVFDGNNQLGVIDFIYNRPRPADDEIPRTFAALYNYPLYGMNLIQTGGNYMSDGINTGIQTTLVYEENSGQTHTQINRKMHDYMGVEDFLVMADPNSTYIDHVDCWGKLLAPDKVLIRSVPNTNSQYNAIEAAVTYFSTHDCAWGYPYRIYRVNTPNNQPYTNSIILNKTVFVPIMNSTYDQAALQVYRSALPGYNVIGVLGSGSTPWQSTDALHCRAHEIPDKNMLNIVSMPLHGDIGLQDNYTIAANIMPYSNLPVYSDSIFVSYKVNQGAWQNTIMPLVSSNNYSASIGSFSLGDTIRYFIHAADQSGHSANHPFTGALDPHIFRIAPPPTPPVITHTPLSFIMPDQFPLTMTAAVTDSSAIGNVIFTYKIDSGSENATDMSPLANNVYYTSLNPELTGQTQHLFYKIYADLLNNPECNSTLPQQGWFDVLIESTSNTDPNNIAVERGFELIYPNPVRSSLDPNISMMCTAKTSDVINVEIYNSKGQKVKTIFSSAKSSGQQILHWDVKNAKQQIVPSGLYLVKMTIRERVYTRKVIIM